jgi:phosphomevalonate kinase
MREIRVTAPGKLVLIGEYAVLESAPAVVMAVNRRARVELADSPNGLWSIAAPDFAPQPEAFELDSRGRLRWLGGSGPATDRFGLVERLFAELCSSGVLNLGESPPFVANLDTRAFFHPAQDRLTKLGLGSSAALTVALTSALSAWPDGEGSALPDGVGLQPLVDLNRRAQGGLGSGIDIAACLLGGVIRYQLEADGESVRMSSRLSLPEDLHLVCIWTGRSASTSDFLEVLRARRVDDPRGTGRAMRRLGEISGAAIAALEEARTATFLAEVEAFWNALADLGEHVGLPILSEEHRQLRRLAEESGAAYKPSGAGGGDFGLVFAADPEIVDAASRRATAAGFFVIDLLVDPSGLRCERDQLGGDTGAGISL